MPQLPVHVASIIGFLLAILLLAGQLKARRAPSVTIAWFLLLLLAPWLGVPLFLVFGGRSFLRRSGDKKPLYDVERPHAENATPLERLLDGMRVPSTSNDNAVTLVTTGEEGFRTVLDLIDGAERTIYIGTFILDGGEVGNAIVDRLAERAKSGIDVRLLIDGLFSFRTNRARLKALRHAGGRVAFFMPLLHVPFRGRSNLRLHRKIAVADGARAMVGGMNLAGEYMGPTPSPKRWKDIAVRIDGGAAADLEDIFLEDWSFASRKDAPSTAAREPAPKASRGSAPVRAVASGPDVATDTLYDAILFALFTATERILIATPYFVPDAALARAIALACRRGVDVQVVIPSPSNHVIADLAGAPYLRDIEAAGGQVRPYRSGMLHAKVIVVDRSLAMVGSANLDMRSLYLDYEVMALLYGEKEIEDVAAWFAGVAATCASGMRPASRLRAATEDVVRLFGPLV